MKDLFLSASNMLTARSVWEQKYRLYFRMIHDGLPRLNKPFPTASDGHIQVIDKAIRKQKPFWGGQILAGDKLCNFTSMRPQTQALSACAADYYDFETRNNSGLLDEIETMLFFMLMMGRGIMKTTVDPLDEYKLKDEALDPYFVIFPQEANDFDDADEFIHVIQSTVAAYERKDDRWNKEPAVIRRIRGSKDFQSIGILEQQVATREGLTFTRNENQILIFEHWTKTAGGYTVNTYCPMAPDIQLRKPYGCPYKMNGKVFNPFTSVQMEIKDKGWYSPRGLSELLAPWEQYQTKLLNEKADAITFANRPLYTGEKEILNMANFRWQPGEYIPGNIRGVQQGVPPISFDQEILSAKSEAEEVAQSPDFGITQSGPTGGKARTATENERIAALQQAGNVYNGQMFRRKITTIHQKRWALMCQFKERKFAYYASQEIKTLPEQALHDEYLITPDGSPDAWNPMAKFQKSVVGLQTFANNPNVNMEVLTRQALTDYNGKLAIEAFVPTNQKGMDEYNDQVMLINSMMAPLSGKPSMPVQAKPNSDHASRIKATIDWIHACGAIKTPVDPVARQRVQQNLMQHVELLKQQNPKAGKEIAQMLQQMEQPQQQAQQPQQVAQAPMV